MIKKNKEKFPTLYKIFAFVYRFFSPLFDIFRFIKTIKWYFWYIKDLFLFKKKWWKIKILDLYPILLDKTYNTGVDYHYFYQQLWCFNEIIANKPEQHIDIGSTYSMSWYIASITKAVFVDIRPINIDINNLFTIKWDIINLPFKNNSIESLSCLHVIEHIWLWRYWDKLDVNWDIKWISELKRVLQKWWKLYFSTPIWKEKIQFNAHKIYHINTIIKYFNWLNLKKLNFVFDNWTVKYNADLNDISNKIDKWEIEYWLWFFIFTK